MTCRAQPPGDEVRDLHGRADTDSAPPSRRLSLMGLASRSEDASGRGRRPLGDLVRSRLPGADIRRGDVGSVTELGGGADRAPDRDLGSLVVFGVVAAEGDPALAEFAATAPTLNAIQHRRTPFPRRAPRHATPNLTGTEAHVQVAVWDLH